MDIDLLLRKSEKLEIDTYKKPPSFPANHASFEGTPRKHPYNSGRIILITKPFCKDVCYYEFKLSDVDGMEEMSNIVDQDGNSLPVVRIWVKKGHVAIKSVPFIT